MYRHTESRQKQVYHIATQKLRARTRRSPILLIGMFFSMLTIGLLGLVLSPMFTQPSFSQTIQRQGGTHTTVSSTPSPTPSPTPTPQPVEPLPPTLNAQIAFLQARNRLFYHGNTSLPEIALTFDDGPNPVYTPQVLAILRTYHIPATFFTIGSQVQRYLALVRQEVTEGHEVGNHSWSHPDLPRLSPGEIQMQIQKTSDAIEQATGRRPVFFRPPYGDVSTSVLPVVNRLGLSTVIWNNEARDWALPGTSIIVARILNLAGNGSIILMHDGGGNRSQTVAALPKIIEQLTARHYTFVSMSDLVKHLPAQTPPSTSTSAPSISTPVTLTPMQESEGNAQAMLLWQKRWSL